MKNVTIVLDEEVARWTRILAARRNTSVSRLVGDILRERMQQEEGYEREMQRFLSAPARALKSGGRCPTRDEVHER